MSYFLALKESTLDTLTSQSIHVFTLWSQQLPGRMWHPFSSGVAQSAADLTWSVASDCARGFRPFFTLYTCTLTPPHCFRHGHMKRLEMWSCGRSGTVLHLCCLKSFHLSIFSNAKPFLFQYARNIFFLKHSVIDNFHTKTTDLPFYRSEMEARSRHLTFFARKASCPGCPLTRSTLATT